MTMKLTGLFLSPIYKYQVVGNSMFPTYREKDMLFVNRLSYLFSNPKPDDVIVLRDPRTKREILKRITKITTKGYFVEGDNKKESTDSHVFGFVQKNQIIGKVIGLKV